MNLLALVPDKLCSGRLVGYFKDRVQVFYKHELRSLAELFSASSDQMSPHFSFVLEMQSLTDVVGLDQLDLPPPEALLESVLCSAQGVRVAQTCVVSASALILMSASAHALPTGFNSVTGDATAVTSGQTMTVTTGVNKSIATYQNFNVAQGETVNFNLPSAQSAILNRVQGGNVSQIMGAVNSNGQVFLSNSAGIIFGQNAQVNVGSIMATTLDINNADFSAGHYSFHQVGDHPGSVVNQGHINVAQGGFAVLAGGAINNSGTITANGGSVHLAVGKQVSMTVDSNMAVDVTVDQALSEKVDGVNEAIHNSGTITANGGLVKMVTNLQNNLYAKSVNNEGIIQANGFGGQAGSIVIEGTGGDVVNSGQMTANADVTQGVHDGGQISVSGTNLSNQGSIQADAADSGTGGTINLNASQDTTLTSGSVISADGHGSDSTGGHIRVWSDNNTDFQQGAKLSVRGGDVSGDGGFVEVSAHNSVSFAGLADGTAVNGTGGSILIDPTDIVIQNSGGDINPQAGGGFAGMSSISLSATHDITLNSALDTDTATGNSGVSLALSAGHNLTINAAVTTHNAAIALSGSNSLVINAAVKSNGGGITLTGDTIINAAVDAGSGNLAVNAPTHNLNVNAALSGNDISLDGYYIGLNNNAVVNATHNLNMTAHWWDSRSISLNTGSSINAGNVIL